MIDMEIDDTENTPAEPAPDEWDEDGPYDLDPGEWLVGMSPQRQAPRTGWLWRFLAALRAWFVK